MYEREADAVAEKVMRMPAPKGNVPFFGGQPLTVSSIQRKCAACEEEEKHVQKKGEGGMAVAPPSVHNVLASGGQSMDAGTRNFMESRFGHDFGSVRIHTDSRASASAQSINALAYTSGNDVVFADREYAPTTASGRRLIAHELTHVIQQSGKHKEVQRLIRTSAVACPAGRNPFGADRRASTLLGHAITVIDAARATRAANPADPQVVLISNSMRTAFRLNPATVGNWDDPVPHFGLVLIRTRLEMVKNYIDSVVFNVNCVAAAGVHPLAGCGTVVCDPDVEAWSCQGNPTDIVLCPPFWVALDQQARTFMHEVFHITFTGVQDWANRDSTNAHCYAQFVALVNGFNSPPGFTCH